MTDEAEQWALRPVGRGLCRYEALVDCTLDYWDLVLMNEYLDVQDENEYRARRAAEQKAGG